MRALVLGGTAFVGRALVERCLARGHDVTVFNRGRSDPRPIPGVRVLVGDRKGDLSALAGQTWDVLFDPSGYEVAPVRASARAVQPPHAVFVSSVSVYADPARMDEAGPVQSVPDPENEPLSLPAYGALKAACERAIEAELPGRVQHVRAGIILGPHDYDARFAYWLRRIAAGGEVLAPGRPEAPVQFVDVRDLADWMVRCAERRVVGTFNATGPGTPVTMASLLDGIREVVGSDARFTWVSDELLVRHAVRPYAELPFWLPASAGRFVVDAGRAVAEGLAYRPVHDTIRDTWAWLRDGWDAEASVRENRAMRVPGGMEADKERRILDEHHASAG